MRISIDTYSEDGDLRHLMYVDWTALPRVGDTIQLTGGMFGDAHSETSILDVDQVVFSAEIDDRYQVHAEDPMIVVSMRRAETAFVPFCTCGPGDRGPDENRPDRCGNCGDRLRR